MLKKVILALAVMGLFGTFAATASAHGYGRGYGCRPYSYGSYGRYYRPSYARPYYGGFYRGPSSYFAPGYSGRYGYGGYGGYYGGYGYGSGISVTLGF